LAQGTDDDKYESFLDDWQICAIVSQKVRFISAYAGMKASACELVYNINKHDKKRRYSDGHIGLVLGSDLRFFKDRVKINLEGRFIDEQALSTSITYLY